VSLRFEFREAMSYTEKSWATGRRCRFSGADAPQFLRLLFWRTWGLRGHTLVAPQFLRLLFWRTWVLRGHTLVAPQNWS